MYDLRLVSILSRPYRKIIKFSCFHLVGNLPCLAHSEKSLTRLGVQIYVLFLRFSDLIISGPGVLLFFNAFIACLIS